MSKASKSLKAASKAGFNPADLVELATDNPYVRRLVEDATIRDNLQQAFESGRRAIDRLTSAKNPAKALLEDKKVQTDLRTALESLRDATTSLTDAPAKRKAKRGGRRLVLITVVGAGAAVAGSEGLRTKVLDTLFGAEEEFQYTPPTAGASESTPPSPVSAA